ncbi:MAG: HAMP domain-containing protein [Fimbriimonadaceae bacterium]|nr:HAMP domain-containing protein [Chitinophagales bacterium]
MKIKSKLSLGLAFLFAVIILLGGFSIYYLNKLSNDASVILVDNYESLEYCKNMLKVLDETSKDASALNNFEHNLTLQQQNITEIGEKEATSELTKHFTMFKQNGSEELRVLIRSDLLDIQEINMLAIERKSIAAESTASKAILYLSIIGAICFLVVFTFIINFPGYIANPIRHLTESIKEIANKKYDRRLHFNSKDEFGDLAHAFNRMAEKLEEYDSSNVAKLLTEKKRIDAIINNMSDPVIGLDENKKIIFANKEAIKVIGIDEKNMLNRYAPDVAATNDLMRNLIKGIMQQPDSNDTSILKIYAGNKESFFSKDIFKVTSPPDKENKTQLIGHVISLKNITPFKETELAKTNFLATVSHELKTPLSAIKMATQLMNDDRIGKLNAEQKQIIQSITDQAQRLSNITGELLDITQIESGNIKLNKQKTVPASIIDYAVNSTKPAADQKHITIETKIAHALPDIVVDSDKTAWVLINLISNAAKFSKENSKVIVSAEKIDNKIRFAVQDFGKGININDKKRIFERFFRVNNSSDTTEGSGLGLAISKEFILAQGGNIFVESEEGKGSVFSFEFPIDSNIL